MQPHIQEELRSVDFDIEKLRILLSGGQEAYNKAQELKKAIESVPELQPIPYFHRMTQEKQIEAKLKQTHAFITKVMPKLGLLENLESLSPLETLNGYFENLSFTMFLRSIRYFGTDDQVKEWMPRVLKLQILGSYAQTELGHGSNVQGLETTATFDQDTDEFIIHSPTVSSTKFWPGNLGKATTHALVIAKLILNSKVKGQQMFIVPLRNLQTLELLPGVECGSVAPKHGLNGKDNGYAIFTNVRIPRKNMLMKYQSVDKNGKFIRKGASKLIYLTLMEGRLDAAQFASDLLFQALLFSFRYATFRTQFKTTSTGKERKLADYQLYQHRLVPYVADAFAYFFLHKKQTRVFQEFKQEGITQEILAGLHSQFSAVKAFTIWKLVKGVTECRERCGGHGYLKSAGFSDIDGVATAATAAQGDNAVMALQSARFIIKNLKLAVLGKDIHPDTYYVRQIKIFDKITSQIESEKDVTLEIIKQSLNARICFALVNYMREVVKFQRLGKEEIDIQRDEVQSDMVKIAKYHFDLFTYTAFIEEIKRVSVEPSLLIHLKRLAKICGITMLRDGMDLLYCGGYFEKNEKAILEEVLKQEIKNVRPVVVGLLEATERGRSYFTSSIGSKDNNPYEELMKEARLSRDSDNSATLEMLKTIRKAKL